MEADLIDLLYLYSGECLAIYTQNFLVYVLIFAKDEYSGIVFFFPFYIFSFPFLNFFPMYLY